MREPIASSKRAWGGALSALSLLLPSIGLCETDVADVSPLRLLELLPQAQLSSPPLEAARRLDLNSVPRRTVAYLDGANPRPAAPSWTAGCRTVKVDTGRRALAATDHPCLLVVPVGASRFLEVRRMIFTPDPGRDLRIVELTGELWAQLERRPASHATLIAAAEALTHPDAPSHQFPPPPLAEWHADRLRLLTGRQTRAVALLLDPAPAVFVDALAVAEFLPEGDQALALANALGPVDTEPSSPTLLAAWPLSIVDAATGNHLHQPAILLPAPTDLVFDLQLPAAARLRGGAAVLPMADREDLAQLSITVETADRPAEIVALLQHESHPRAGASALFDVDLRRWQRQRIRLRFTVRAPAGRRGWLLLGSPVVEGAAHRRDPSLLLVTVDRLAAERLAKLGYGRATTPNLDHLTGEGVLFSHTFAAQIAPEEALSAVLETGSATTLAERLGPHGFLTHAVGGGGSAAASALRGYDTLVLVSSEHSGARHRVDAALRFLTNVPGRFFLHLHLEDLAEPFDLPAPFARRYIHASLFDRYGLTAPVRLAADGTPRDCGRCARRDRSAAQTVVRDLQDAELEFVDQQLARLFASLRDQVRHPTLIAIVGVRGQIGGDPRARLRGSTSGLSDAETRVPLWIIDPSLPPAVRGKEVTALASTADLAPTLLELLGLPPTAVAGAGRSLRPHLLTHAVASDGRLTTVTHGAKPERLAVRTVSHKYLLDLNRGSEALYDLRADPQEQLDLARRTPAVVEALRLAAMEHLVATQPGRYLAIFGDGVPRRFEVRVASRAASVEAVTLHGLTARSQNQGGLSFVGSSSNALVLLARLDLAAEAELDIQLNASGPAGLREKVRALPERFLRPSEDALSDLAGRGRLGWALFAVPIPTPEPAKLSVGRRP